MSFLPLILSVQAAGPVPGRSRGFRLARGAAVLAIAGQPGAGPRRGSFPAAGLSRMQQKSGIAGNQGGGSERARCLRVSGTRWGRADGLLAPPGRAASRFAQGIPSGIYAFIRISGARRRRAHPGRSMIMGRRGPYPVPMTHDHGHRPCRIPPGGYLRDVWRGMAGETASAASPERAALAPTS
jgi:hypothetical protein